MAHLEKPQKDWLPEISLSIIFFAFPQKAAGSADLSIPLNQHLLKILLSYLPIHSILCPSRSHRILDVRIQLRMATEDQIEGKLQ